MHKESQSTRLVQIAESTTLFHDREDRGYATLNVAKHKEHWSIRSRQFKNWLARCFYLEEKRAPNSQALNDAIIVLEGKARFEGGQCTTNIRIAKHENNIYLDLCNDEWQAVKITANGWEVISNPPVYFIRRRGMLSLPTPNQGGDIETLWEFMNIDNDADRKLVLGWLLGAYHPDGPYPILIIQGEQGSAKTTQCRVLRNLIDPSIAPVRTPPKNVQDLMIAARNSWVIAYDNLSGLKKWISDDLCRLAVGFQRENCIAILTKYLSTPSAR